MGSHLWANLNSMGAVVWDFHRSFKACFGSDKTHSAQCNSKVAPNLH